MKKCALLISILSLILDLPSGLPAEEPEEVTQLLCDPADPENECPGPECKCVEDAIEITFDGETDSILQYGGAAPGLSIPVTVVVDVKGTGIQGWAYGVRHSGEDLEILSATTKGTDVEPLVWFDATSMERIETCGADPGCRSEGRTPGGGWVSAFVIETDSGTILPSRRYSLAKAEYRLSRDVGFEGTLIEFTDRLAKEGSPRTNLYMTVDGKSLVWTRGVAGWVKRRVPSDASFLRGDVGLVLSGTKRHADGLRDVTDAIRILFELFGGEFLEFNCEDAADADDNGMVDLTDAIFILAYLFRGGPAPPEPLAAPAPDPTPDDFDCVEYP